MLPVPALLELYPLRSALRVHFWVLVSNCMKGVAVPATAGVIIVFVIETVVDLLVVSKLVPVADASIGVVVVLVAADI